MKRVLLNAARIIGATIVAALLVTGALLIWAAGTESGLQFVWHRVVGQLADDNDIDIDIEALEGRIAGPLVLSGVQFRTPTVQLRIERAELQWHPLALFKRSLDIERVHLRGLDVIQFPSEDQPPEPDGEFPLPERIELPINIHVAQASLQEFRYRSSPDAEALLIEHVDLEGRLDKDEWLLRQLAVRGPLFDATGQARIVPNDVYETQGQLDWVLRSGDYPDANGSTRFSGSLQALTIQQRIEAPYNARAEVRVQQPLGELNLDGELTLTVQPAELGIDLPNSSVNSSLSFEGTLEQVDLGGRVQLSAEQIDGLEAELQARYAEGVLQIERLQLAHPASAAAMRASGRLTLEPELTLDLRTTWSGLQWPLQDEPQISSESGSLELQGTPDRYVLALEADMAMSEGAQGRVRMGGTGSAEALDLEQIEIEVLQGRVVGRAHLTWRPEISAAIELSGDELNPGVLASEWPGRLGATLRADAAVSGQNVTLQVDQLTIDGRLRDRAIEVSAQGAYSIDTLRLEMLSFQSGVTRIDASGTAGRDVALEWRIDSPDLSDLWPTLSGQLSASGRLDGPRLQPRMTVDARGQALGFIDSEVGELTLTADIDVAGKAPSQLDLSLHAAEVQGNRIQELELSGDGNAARHELALATTTDIGEAQITLIGGIAQPWQQDFVWSFELNTATLAHKDFAPWRLREPSRGQVSAAQTQLAQTCWQSGAADLCVEGARQQDRTGAVFSVSTLPLNYFASLLAEPVQIEGEMGLEGTFEQRSGGLPQLNVQLTSSLGRIVSADPAAEEPHVLTFGPLDGWVTMEEDRMAGVLRLPFEQQGELEIQARVGTGAGAPFPERSLEGSLRIQIDELDFVSNMVGALRDTEGTLGGDVQLSGTVGEPLVTGTLALNNGKATVDASNVVLEDLELALASDGSGEITVEAQARSGGGSLNAEGHLALAEAGPEGRIMVSGQAFEVINTLDAQVRVSPDLDLALAPDRLALTGSVTVPEARLTPRDTKESVIAASDDQVIVDVEDEDDQAFTRPLHADVQLELGDAVRLEGYGLTGRLSGRIRITEEPGEPVTGSGELRVEQGVYEAYGQKLEIQTGRVLFAGGPITQPGLDVEAVRRPTEDILVGARVRGTLEAPELSVFSEPTMPQQDQMSYLVLGRPLESTSTAESSALSRAALALGLKGGNVVSERVNENIGLDDFGIQTEPGESASEASFVIGKYLSPSLYVSYGIGLFEPVNTLKLRYTISRRWQLVTESSSEASSGDVIYNIERGN